VEASPVATPADDVPVSVTGEGPRPAASLGTHRSERIAAAPVPARRNTPARKAHVHRARTIDRRPTSLFPSLHFIPATPFDVQAWVHSNPSSPLGAAALATAAHFIGTPYVWGGASPTGGFDCSGLMMYAYSRLGIALPHYAAAQFAAFPHLAPSELRPGDLVFFEPRLDGPGHVAMYAGGDRIIEAPHTGALVRIGSLSGSAFALGFVGAIRPYAAPAGDRVLAATRATAHGAGGRLATI
jgi:cell wall-associated NlpC family hydrolase